MPYVKVTTVAGRTIEVEEYYTSRYKKKGIKRGDKVKPTSEEQKKINNRIAERNLKRILNENFTCEDVHLILSYMRHKDDPHPTKEQMREDIDDFLRGMRSEYKKRGIPLKYIHVPEIGKRGARHHHLVINCDDIKLMRKLWTKGRPKIFPLDESGQYAKLAHYLIKYSEKTVGTDQALTGRRWNSSTNLKRPEPHYDIINDRKWYRAEPKAIKGYYVDADSVEIGIHSPEYYGYGFFRYTLIKDDTG